jgi:hypothetical protein
VFSVSSVVKYMILPSLRTLRFYSGLGRAGVLDARRAGDQGSRACGGGEIGDGGVRIFWMEG